MKKTKSTSLRIAGDLFSFAAGGLIFACSVKLFAAPNHFAPGGLTGLSTVINYLTGFPIGLMAFLLNLPIFIWAILEIGYKLVGKTILATFLSSVAIDTLGMFVPQILVPYTNEPLLAAVCGGALEGIGLSLVFLRGATTGGTDLVARLLGRRFRHLSMGRLMMVVDGVIIVFSAVVYQSLESGLHAAIATFVSTRVIDAILYGTDVGTGKLLYVISEQSEQIASRILTEIDRGVTKLSAKGGYSGREGELLLCALRRDEVHRVIDIVHECDENAFLIVGEAGSITGEGFRSMKKDDSTLQELLGEQREKRRAQKRDKPKKRR